MYETINRHNPTLKSEIDPPGDVVEERERIAKQYGRPPDVCFRVVVVF